MLKLAAGSNATTNDGDRGRRLASHTDDTSWQTRIVAHRIQRDVQAIRREQPAIQSMLAV
jgi:hypothetical protein